MSVMDYQRSVRVHATSDDIYLALTQGIEHWWTRPDKPILKEGDTATFTFPPNQSYWSFTAKKLLPDKMVTLVCTDGLHIHEGVSEDIATEWLDTQLIWEIKNYGIYREIDFTHLGLEPELLCFEVCKRGWDHFFLVSLPAYLDLARGQPHVYSGG